MLHTEEYQTRRHTLSLPARVSELSSHATDDAAIRGTIISFSAVSCAIRTNARLLDDRDLAIHLILESDGPTRYMRIPARVVSGRDDYRIDTLYHYELRFLSPLREADVREVLREEEFSADLTGPYPSDYDNKSVA